MSDPSTTNRCDHERTRGLLIPTRRVHALTDVRVGSLALAGVHCVLVDRDNTCVPRDTGVVPEPVRMWFAEAQAAGITICMVTNNFHSRQAEDSARDLDCAVVHHAMKPAPFALWRALERAGASAAEAVLIGDQVFTDVLAGNLAGVRTILVEPQSSCDLWYTHLLHGLERIVGARPSGAGKDRP